MDPKLQAILTILVVGIVSFILGKLFSGGWRKKHDDLQREYDQIKNSKLRLENESKNNQQVISKLDHSNKANLRALDEKEETINILKDKIQNTKSPDNSKEISELKSRLEDEKIKTNELERDLQALKNQSNAPSEVDTKPLVSVKGIKISKLVNSVTDSNNSQKDDLTQIENIDQNLAKKLNKIGIVNFRQLSKLRSSELQAIHKSIQHYPGRALRNGIIQEAKDLFGKKYGMKI